MKRVIVNYNKLTDNILNLLIEKYPDGYNDSDIVTFKNLTGELIEAVEVRTDDTIYLVKVSVKLKQSMIDFAEDDDEVFEKEIDFSQVSLADEEEE